MTTAETETAPRHRRPPGGERLAHAGHPNGERRVKALEHAHHSRQLNQELQQAAENTAPADGGGRDRPEPAVERDRKG